MRSSPLPLCGTGECPPLQRVLEPPGQRFNGGSPRLWQTQGVASQTWNSPVSSPSPPPWVVAESPPAWFTELAEKEGSGDDAVVAWREALVELGVVEVRLTADVRGVTIDFDGTAPQAVNDDNAKPLTSAIGRGVDRLRTKKKSEDGDRARRSARDSPDESE
jgi:hypothetical protein